MSNFLVYIKLPSYLRQWFVNRHSGSEPVVLNRGCIESKILKLALQKLPEGMLPAKQQEGELAICIPYSKARDPRIYNYISPTGKKALIENINNSFAVDCWNALHDFGKIGQQQKTLIYLFMETHGIKEDGACWDNIAKVYQRLRKNAVLSEKRKSERIAKTKDSSIS